MYKKICFLLSIIGTAVLIGCTSFSTTSSSVISNSSTDETVIEDFEKLIIEENNNVEDISDSESEEETPTEELSEIEPEMEEREFEVVDISTLPEGLEVFLVNLEWLGNYDFEDENIMNNYMTFCLQNPYTICDFSHYKDYINVPDINDYYLDKNFFVGDYYVYDSDGVDWIMKNIFNFSESKLDSIKKNYNEQNERVLYKEGKYYASAGGVGGGWNVIIKNADSDGKQYHVVYKIEDVYEPGKYRTKYAILEYKLIEGKGYWSAYKTSESSLFELAERDDEANQEPKQYTNEELAELTKAYYLSKYRLTPQFIDVFDDEDNNVSIHIYDIVENVLDNGEVSGHTSTYDWWLIDRSTAKGTDLMGDTVDLSLYEK